MKNAEKENEPKFRRNKDAKIKLIIDTFLQLIEKKGYANVSTNQVAERAGISIGTIYNYFENKADILAQGLQSSIDNFGDPSDFISILVDHDELKAKSFVKGYLEGHQSHYKQNEAIDLALVQNQEVFRKFQSHLKNTVQLYSEQFVSSIPQLAKIPIQNLVNAIMISMNNIDTMIHQHLFRDSLFESDDDLIDYLAFQFIATLQFFKI
jgi:AcrR family transcriptional regulator